MRSSRARSVKSGQTPHWNRSKRRSAAVAARRRRRRPTREPAWLRAMARISSEPTSGNKGAPPKYEQGGGGVDTTLVGKKVGQWVTR